MQEIQAETTAGMKFVVREYTDGDKEKVEKLLSNLLIDPSLSYAVDFEKALQTLQPEFPPSQNCVIAVSEQGILGCCQLLLDNRPQYSHVGYLKIFYSKEVHGVGVGEPLLKMTIGLARKNKLQRLEIRVNAERRGARALYRKLGFVEEATLVKSYKAPDGSLHDEIILALVFNSDKDESDHKVEEAY